MTPVAWLRKLASGWAQDCPAGLPVPTAERCAAVDCDSVPLTALAEGEHACITCLQQPGGVGAAKLSALGVLPGVELELIQRFPAYVLRIGYADIAVDDALAGCVRVRRF